MRIVEIRRYPVKSLLGERLAEVEVEDRGLVGDRLWAVRDPDGKLGSGKNTRRFRRMPGLFDLRAHHAEPVPVVELPDGRRFAADDPAGHAALGDALGRSVTVAREADVRHHDEGPVSVITTAGLDRLAGWIGEDVDPLRFRANLLVEASVAEDDWPGRSLRIGPDVVLRAQSALTRCVMVDVAQEHLPEHGQLLKTLADRHDLTFGVWATVERPGRLALDDPVILGPW